MWLGDKFFPALGLSGGAIMLDLKHSVAMTVRTLVMFPGERPHLFDPKHSKKGRSQNWH